jgi:hypothetical protein
MQNRIRLGILALPLSGFLGIISNVVPGVWIDPSVDPVGFARASAAIGLANMIGIPVGFLLPIGTLALYLFLAGTPVDKWALGGLLLMFAGMGLFMPFLGIFAVATPVLGRHYLNGDTTAINVIPESTATSNPAAFTFGGTAVLLLFISSVLFGVAIWQSHRLPRWSGIIYATATPLWVDPLYNYQPAIAVLGSILLLASSGWIAASIDRKRS